MASQEQIRQQIATLQGQAREWQAIQYRAAQLRNSGSLRRAQRELRKLWKEIDHLRAELK